MKDMTKLRI